MAATRPGGRQRIGARARRAVTGRAGGAWLRFTRRRTRDAALARLRADDDPAVAAVGRALTAAVGSPAPEEEAWIARIEALRADLGRDPGLSRLAHEVAKPAEWGRVLLNLNRELGTGWSLELGTSIGLSSAYQAAGQELRGASDRVVTVEQSVPKLDLARGNLEGLGLAHRVELRQGRFRGALRELFADLDAVGFAFVDGHHRERATLRYFERIVGHLATPGVLLFDDITWSRGMRRAWARISADPRVALAMDLHGLGLCVVRGGGGDAPRSVPHVLDVVLHPDQRSRRSLR